MTTAGLQPPFHGGNMKYAYQLHYHLGFNTKRNAKILVNESRQVNFKEFIATICKQADVRMLESASEPNWVRMLISLKPGDVPAKTVQTIKANTSRLMFQQFPELETETGRRSHWSRGYFLRSVGDVTDETILQYLAKQREHHESTGSQSVFLAGYAASDPDRFFDLRSYSHCQAEYNCHLVCCPVGHVGAIDAAFAEPLIGFIRKIAGARRFELIRVAVLSDHLHVFAALRPNQSPEFLATTIMNNTSWWFGKNNPGVFKAWDVPGFWTCSAFVRSAGAVTTNHVRAYLRTRGLG